MQVVLGGEPDAGEHLLAVPGRGAGAAPGDAPWPSRRSPACRRARPRRARRRPSRWRRASRPGGGGPPGTSAIGWPNWTRSSACSRASASIVRDTPTSSWPTATCAERDAAVQSTGVGRRPIDATSPCDLDQAEPRVDAVHRRRSSVGDARPWRATSSPVDRATTTARPTVAARGAEAVRPSDRRRAGARRPDRPSVGQHDRGVGVELAARARTRPRGRAPTSVRVAAPCSSNSSETAARGSIDERVGPAELGERGVERGTGVLLGGVRAGCARTARGRRAVASAVVPEVEQAAGDDVALDLGAAAVDRRRPRVQELAAPPLAGRRRRRCVTLGGQRRRPPGRTRPARRSPAAPCRSTSPAPSVSPRGQPVLRGARPGPERVERAA